MSQEKENEKTSKWKKKHRMQEAADKRDCTQQKSLKKKRKNVITMMKRMKRKGEKT